MKKNKNSYNIYGIKVNILSNNIKLLNFIEKNYYFFKSKKNFLQSEIEIILDSRHFINLNKNKKKLINFGNSIFYNKDNILWSNEYGLNISLKIKSKNKWIINCYHFDIDKKISQKKMLENFNRIMRFAIHLPIFKKLNLKKGFFLLHGSGVVYKSNATIFIGLNKVGKSTLSSFIVENSNAKFLSDNFIISDGYNVYPFFERIRLDEKSLNFLKINKSKTYLYSKYHLEIFDKIHEDKSRLKNVYIVNNSQDFSIKKLNNKDGLRLVHNISNLLQEFPEYHYLTLIDYLLNTNKKYELEFDKKINFNIITLPNDFSLRKNLKNIIKCIY